MCLVCRHKAPQIAKTGENKPHEVVDVTEDVGNGDGEGDVEAVDIELSWLARALKKVTMNIKDDGVSMLKNRETFPAHVEEKNGCHSYFEQCSE